MKRIATTFLALSLFAIGHALAQSPGSPPAPAQMSMSEQWSQTLATIGTKLAAQVDDLSAQVRKLQMELATAQAETKRLKDKYEPAAKP